MILLLITWIFADAADPAVDEGPHQPQMQSPLFSEAKCEDWILQYEHDIAEEFKDSSVLAYGPTKNIRCTCHTITIVNSESEFPFEHMVCEIWVRPDSEQEKNVMKRLRMPPQEYDEGVNNQLPSPIPNLERLPFFILFRDAEEYLEPRIMYRPHPCRHAFQTEIQIKKDRAALVQRSQSFSGKYGDSPIAHIPKSLCQHNNIPIAFETGDVVYVANHEIWRVWMHSEVICIPAQMMREHVHSTQNENLMFRDPLDRTDNLDLDLDFDKRGYRRIQDYTAFIIIDDGAELSGACGSMSGAGPSIAGAGFNLSPPSTPSDPASDPNSPTIREPPFSQPGPSNASPLPQPGSPKSPDSPDSYQPFGRFTLPESPGRPYSPVSAQPSPVDRSRTDSTDSSPPTPPGFEEHIATTLEGSPQHFFIIFFVSTAFALTFLLTHFFTLKDTDVYIEFPEA